jgi:LytS/YehU family sensor histidine kinase
VENAIKYGTMQQSGPVEVAVRVWNEQGKLHARITNPGTLASDADSTGVGLRNAEQRLQLLFGRESSIKLGAFDGLVTATAIWPAQSVLQ